MEGEAVYQCCNCDQHFTNRKGLALHSKLDHPKCEVVCQPCGNHFRKQKDLKFHRRQAASSKPLLERFICVHCKRGAIFNHPQELADHAQKHHGGKSACCCGNLFKTKTALELHSIECFHYEQENQRH